VARGAPWPVRPLSAVIVVTEIGHGATIPYTPTVALQLFCETSIEDIKINIHTIFIYGNEIEVRLLTVRQLLS